MLLYPRLARKGGVTKIAINGKVTVFEECQLTGHSTGTGVDYYYDKTNPANGLRAMKARVGYHDIDSPFVVPSLDVLGKECKKNIDRFMSKLYKDICVPQFLPGGELRPVLHIATTSLILYHNEVTRDVGQSNFISSTYSCCNRKSCEIL